MSHAGDDVPELRGAFLSAMRKLAATITLITTRGDDGVRHGMAATAISSLTAEPPTLLACINRQTSIHREVKRREWFCLNLLAQNHKSLFSEFVARPGASRFEVGTWLDGIHGLPYLPGAVANIFCCVQQQVEYGTHTIFIGKVDLIQVDPAGDPLIYQDARTGSFCVP